MALIQTRLGIGITVLSFAASSAAVQAADCAAMKSLKLDGTTINVAEAITTGRLEVPGMAPMEGVPSFCRISGILRPTSDSKIHFEVWLPEKDWNGRLLGTGNGGFAGEIYLPQLEGYLKRGFAVAGSDAGHQAEGTDATWAFGHPEKVKDFGWRAVHLMTERAKQLIQAYYGKPQNKAYFEACSDGGREALMEAQRFPDDYDGILAGAPANAWSSLLGAGVGIMQKLDDPKGYISDRKLPAIQKAALDACDAQDGVKDGIVNDPPACKFDPSVLLCKGEDELDCLTPPQIETLNVLYTGLKGADGESLWPGYAAGDEAGWRQWVLGENPESSVGAQFVRNYFRYMVADPKWNAQTVDAVAMLKLSQAKMAADLDATNPDLGPFAAHGGKLILYHGWDDPAISPWNTVAYFKQVQHTMGAEKAAGFMRLYMVPGMEHCSGGPGASAMGQFGMPTAKGPQFGIFDSLVDWVEKGAPVENVFATKFAPGADGKVTPAITRPLCAYPAIAKYKGTGNSSLADTFECSKP